MNRLSYSAIVVVALVTSLSSVGSAAQYSIRDLGDLGPDGSAGNALNNRGEVVGQAASYYAQTHAFIYSHGKIHELSVLQGGNSWAYGINDKGHVVGQTLVSSGNNRYEHAFLDFSDLGAIIGATNSGAEDINDSGDVVGTADSGAYWYSKGQLHYLDANNEYGSYASGINNRGDIVGGIEMSDGSRHAFIYTAADSQLTDIETLGGPSSDATDVNDNGVFVGTSDLDNVGNAAAFMWKHGTMVPLQSLGGNGVSANAINNNGVIVGFSADGTNKARAAIWDSTGLITDLNTLLPPGSGWVLQFANDINDWGQITGQGTHNGRTHAFLMTPPLRVQLADVHNTPLVNCSTKVVKVNNDPPAYTEHQIGTFVTNGKGWLEIPSDSLTLDDSVKFEIQVKSEPAVKHTAVLGTMYTIYLDNCQFDSLGNMSIPILADDADQVVLDHTTIAWDLLVSIEWDASEAYLTSTETGFQKASNYLYDVSDGQMRFDTIMILDSKTHWGDADLQIYANNVQWAQASPAGVYDAAGDKHLFLPRVFYGDSATARSHSVQSGFERIWNFLRTIDRGCMSWAITLWGSWMNTKSGTARRMSAIPVTVLQSTTTGSWMINITILAPVILSTQAKCPPQQIIRRPAVRTTNNIEHMECRAGITSDQSSRVHIRVAPFLCRYIAPAIVRRYRQALRLSSAPTTTLPKRR